MPIDPREAHSKEEAAIHNRAGLYAHEMGLQVDLGDVPEPGPEDAVAHLKQLPPADAIAKAREWTGDNTISTLAEAIAAVRETAGGE